MAKIQLNPVRYASLDALRATQKVLDTVLRRRKKRSVCIDEAAQDIYIIQLCLKTLSEALLNILRSEIEHLDDCNRDVVNSLISAFMDLHFALTNIPPAESPEVH